MPETRNYDLVVIGAGPAGENGAVAARLLGKKVALIEKCPVVGGAATNTGTLPSKTLRETALALSGFRARKLFGVDLSLRREATVTDFLYHEKNVRLNERERILQNLDRNKVDLIYGTGSFVDSQTVLVSGGADGDVLLKGERILIAVGSAPFRPAEFCFEHTAVHDSDELLDIDKLPKRMAVVGAGVIGSEYACMFATLGCKVTLIDGKDVLLPFLDSEVSKALVEAMERLGITFVWNERVASCASPDQGDVVLTLSSGRTLSFDQVLVAAGRVSHSEKLNLVAAGVVTGKRGQIQVDRNYRTNIEHIYAAGDVIGFPALASTSMEQARIAVCHAFGATFELEMSRILPYGIYTIPEASMAGETEETLKTKGVEYLVGKAEYSRNARGEIIGDNYGFLKLLIDNETHKLLGIHAIGEQATELVHIGLTAMLLDGKAEIFTHMCFNYPTLGDLYKYAAYDALMKFNFP
ncbi:MAG: Si-specific NAD(P)(+) transhydrogenase [Planctomycetes bacterium]|nr:Si-specific NAD(P)(+) transhydrogenase [Planctomycetota bacterium]